MAEFDAVVISNPLTEDFTWNYNGEPYTIKAGETRPFAQYVSYHLAKHLSSQIIRDDFRKKWGKRIEKDRKLQGEVSQLMVYGNPKRQIALYKIFRYEKHVQGVLAAYPFKGYIGEIKEYTDFLAKEKEKTENVKSEVALEEEKTK